MSVKALFLPTLACEECHWILATPADLFGTAWCANKNCKMFEKQLLYDKLTWPLEIADAAHTVQFDS